MRFALILMLLCGCLGARLLGRRSSSKVVSPDSAPQSPGAPLAQSGKSEVVSGEIYFVATPLGNLEDITLRAIKVLSSVDIICAEDTRNTAKLLRLLGIKPKRLMSHHEHNWQQSTPELVRLLGEGCSVALVSDAGTPGIADPGAPLAAACAAAGIQVRPVPGPSSVVAALSISGLSASRFTFFGFVPAKGKERREIATALMSAEYPCVFFEAPHRIHQTMELLHSLVPVHGERTVVVCRELTKLHEETFRGSLSQTRSWLGKTNPGGTTEGGNDNELEAVVTGNIRGEFTIVLAPHVASESDTTVTPSSSAAATKDKVIALLEQLRDDGVSRSEAVRIVADMADVKLAGARRGAIYSWALTLEDWR